jgi:hypothetical protein
MLAIALLGMFSVGAHAADPVPAPLSRAQVRAEYVRAHDAGELTAPGDLYRSVREAMIESQRTLRAQALAREAQRIAALPVQRQASAAK